jgi:hypothetical protein
MPRKLKARPAELPVIPAELLEQLGNGPMTAEAIDAATLALKKALIERVLGGEPSNCRQWSTFANPCECFQSVDCSPSGWPIAPTLA